MNNLFLHSHFLLHLQPTLKISFIVGFFNFHQFWGCLYPPALKDFFIYFFTGIVCEFHVYILLIANYLIKNVIITVKCG
jgi:hypothetical protein